MSTRVRFAPSPTGFLHIGGVRTALFNYLFAKQTGGSFILRLEDTDRERFVAAGIEQIVASLDWLGLVPDEGFWISQGKHQHIDYIQSERHKTGIYQKRAKALLDLGLAYYSTIAPPDYAKLKKAAEQEKRPFIYRREFEPDHNPKPGDYPIRLDITAIQKLGQVEDPVPWSDLARGEFEDRLDGIEDFIIIKSDGFPTYNFANVVDDYDMGITHVIRGDEFIASTAKHALLYDLFDWPRPAFVHLPVINGTDGKKLSKRSGDTNALDYRNQGYLPEALINFLALLGWNPGAGETQEIFSRDELIKRFSLDHIQHSPAVFDPGRLDWMNGEYIRALPPEELLDRLIEYLDGSKLAKLLKSDRPYSLSALELVQERMKRLGEAEELLGFFFSDPNPKQLDFGKRPKSEVKKLLEITLVHLEGAGEQFEDVEDLENYLRTEVIKAAGVKKPGDLFMSIRIAITGQTATPGLFETMVVLGQEVVLRRLKAAIKAL